MKKQKIIIEYSEEKRLALEIFAAKLNVSDILVKALDDVYEQYVPEDTRKYIKSKEDLEAKKTGKASKATKTRSDGGSV